MTEQTIQTSTLVRTTSDWRKIAARNNALYWDWSPSRMGHPVAHWDDLWAGDPRSPNPFPNSATVLEEITGDDSGEFARRLFGFYTSRSGGPFLLWSAWPMAELAAQGMQLVGRPPLMMRMPDLEIERSERSDLTVKEVTDSAQLSDWLHVIIHGYPAPELGQPGVPPLYDERVIGANLHLYVGYAGGEAVSCSAAFADEDVNGIFAVATLPGARGRGFGRALTAAAAGRSQLPSVLTASDLGFGVYRSLGFEEMFRFELWTGQRGAPHGTG